MCCLVDSEREVLTPKRLERAPTFKSISHSWKSTHLSKKREKKFSLDLILGSNTRDLMTQHWIYWSVSLLGSHSLIEKSLPSLIIRRVESQTSLPRESSDESTKCLSRQERTRYYRRFADFRNVEYYAIICKKIFFKRATKNSKRVYTREVNSQERNWNQESTAFEPVTLSYFWKKILLKKNQWRMISLKKWTKKMDLLYLTDWHSAASWQRWVPSGLRRCCWSKFNFKFSKVKGPLPWQEALGPQIIKGLLACHRASEGLQRHY